MLNGSGGNCAVTDYLIGSIAIPLPQYVGTCIITHEKISVFYTDSHVFMFLVVANTGNSADNVLDYR